MKILKCKQSFAEGHKGREKYPLRTGEYKLRENLLMFEKYLLELDRIPTTKKHATRQIEELKVTR